MTFETGNFPDATSNETGDELVGALKEAWEALDALEAVMMGKYADWVIGESDYCSALLEPAHQLCRRAISLMLKELSSDADSYPMKLTKPLL